MKRMTHLLPWLTVVAVACGRTEEQAALPESAAKPATQPAVATAGKPLIHVWKSPT